LAFVIVIGVAFVNLGEWQLRRLDERRTGNDIVAAHEAQPPRPYRDVFGRVITDADQWQRVIVTGTFDGAHQLQVRYRSNAGRVGSEVLTPLRTTSGDVLLVSRGLIVRTTMVEPDPSALPAPPTGQVTVIGYVRRNEIGNEVATMPAEGAVRLVDSTAIGRWMGEPVLNGYVAAISVEPGQSGDLVAIQPPELSEGPHFWYSVQWFMFLGMAVVGLFWFIRGDIVKLRAERRAAAQEP
jgi:cytochrome oxidase assembly protein ShyY1